MQDNSTKNVKNCANLDLERNIAVTAHYGKRENFSVMFALGWHFQAYSSKVFYRFVVYNRGCQVSYEL